MIDLSSENYNIAERVASHHALLNRSLDYLISETGLDKKVDTSKKPSWLSYGYYNKCIYSLELNDIKLGKKFLVDSLENYKEFKSLSISELNFDISSKNKIELIENELFLHKDKSIEVGTVRENQKEERKKLSRALMIIEEISPKLRFELESYIDEIILTGHSEGNYIRSAASFNLFGLILINANRKNSILFYIEHIIHELSHVVLYTAQSYDELTLNPAEEKYKAPYRADLRPMDGLYHAYFVMCRIISILSKLGKANFSLDFEEERENRLQSTIDKFYQTHNIMKKNAVFTHYGEFLFNQCAKQVRNIT
ncbi:aKG-HExxH-type peptide beta-hydroxylase [Marinomonas balearica]|nr:HEXXH motif-containing putative peptide modification protein [Marinomonas balearica]